MLVNVKIKTAEGLRGLQERFRGGTRSEKTVSAFMPFSVLKICYGGWEE